jgi:hypothetical protein
MTSANDEGANQVKRFYMFVILLLLCVVWSLTSTQYVYAQATLESPQPGSFHSGSGVISGWACDANQIDIVLIPPRFKPPMVPPGRYGHSVR